MNVLNQLAMDWLDCATADRLDATRIAFAPIRERLHGSAQARRNCAWELQRLLRELDKQNPPSGGSLASHADLGSA